MMPFRDGSVGAMPVRPPFGGESPLPPGVPTNPLRPRIPSLGSFKKGGKVKKTGTYKLHKGERVLTKQQAKNIRAKANKILAK